MRRKLLEKHIERPVVEYAKKRGVIVRKMDGFGYRAWPDRMLLGPEGRVLFIEFKRPGGTTTPLQAQLHSQLEALGHEVQVLDDVAKAKKWVDWLIEGDV